MKKYLLIVFALLCLFSINSCKEDNTDTKDKLINFQGIAIDNQDYPIPYAEIEIYEESPETQKAQAGLLGDKYLGTDTTDEDGNFSIDLATIENIYFIIKHEDFQDIKHKIKDLIKSNGKTFLKGDKKEECKSVLYVHSGNSGDNPMFEASKIRIYRGDKLIRKAKFNNEGIAKFEEVCPGKYTIDATLDNQVAREFIEINGTDEYTLTLKFEVNKDTCCDNILYFFPKDEDGNIIDGAKVKLYKGDKLIEAPVVKDGKAVIDGVCEGEYVVIFSKDGYNSVEFKVTVECGKNLELTKIMEKKETDCCDGVLGFVLQNKDKERVKGTILLKKEGKETKSSKTENGEAKFTGLCEGKYTIVIEADGYERMEFTYEVKCNETNSFTKTLVAKSGKDTCCENVLYFFPKDKDGNIIDGAKVKLYKGDKLIEAPVVKDGKAVIDGVCEGEYVVIFSKDGYNSVEFKVTVECGKNLELTKIMEKKETDCCDGVLGFVLQNKDKERVKGTILLKKDGKETKSSKTENGEAKFTSLCEGKYTIVIEADGYERMEFTYEVKCNEANSFTKTLVAKSGKDTCCENVLYFFPKDKDGNIIEGTKVKLYKGDKLIEDPVVKDGKAVIDGVCEGEYVVIFSKDGYNSVEFKVTVECGKNLELTKIMEKKETDCCEAIIKVYVKDMDFKYIENAEVEYILNGKVVAQGKTNIDGHFMAEKLCLGTYTIVIKKDGFKAFETTWKIKECKTYQETFKLSK